MPRGLSNSLSMKAANKAMQIDAIRAVRLQEWSCPPHFIMQTTIAYSATDGGVICDMKSHQYMWRESRHLGFCSQYPTRACDKDVV